MVVVGRNWERLFCLRARASERDPGFEKLDSLAKQNSRVFVCLRVLNRFVFFFFFVRIVFVRFLQLNSDLGLTFFGV